MAVVQRNTSPVSSQSNNSVLDIEQFDITANLVTLRVESSFPDEKKKYLKLRARSHMLQTSICAQISFLVASFNEARRIYSEILSEHRVVGARLFDDRRDLLKVGIIGCGHLGQRLVTSLLSYGGCRPRDIMISTRRPESLDEIKEKGIVCMYDNVKVVKSCHFVILSVLPCQLAEVMDEIRGQIPSHCIIYNLIPDTPLSRLKQVLRHNQIIVPDFTCPKDTEHADWDFGQDVVDGFQRIEMVQLTCPVSDKKFRAVVQTNEKWFEVICYALVNHCAYMGLKSLQAIQIVNRVLLGITDTNPGLLLLDADDLTRQPLEPDDVMPTFDLTAVALHETPLTRKLSESNKIHAAFHQRYIDVFEQYNFKLRFDPLHLN